jgi:hypothetical protein
MNNKIQKYIIISVVALIVLGNAIFVVDQRSQALVVQFGEVVRVINKPGIKMKIPLMQEVMFFDKRILDLGIADQEVIASDQKRLIINAFTKYQIVDPLKFYTTVRTKVGVESKLSAILDSSLRQTIGEVPLVKLLSDDRSTIMSKIKENINIVAEVNNIDDILKLIDTYKDDPAIQYNINMSALHKVKEPLTDLNNIIHIDKIIDLDKKVEFINTCDAMLWARNDGETFGLSIAEFSSKNKPVIATPNIKLNPKTDLAHFHFLKDKGIWYNESNLYNILTTFITEKNIEEIKSTDWNAFKDYTPEKVIKIFENVFIK